MNRLTSCSGVGRILAAACLLIISHTVPAADCFESAGKDAGIDPDLL
ncbi:lytic transglycosylase, partial [Salmonella enterica]|nr:lytic transglycosylase [Salmonella enterica]EJX4360647.1 lytic transglycosylase [Salmonella enterica]